MRVGELKNGKSTSKDEITGEMIKVGGERVVERILRLCNMAFENSVAPEEWMSSVIIPLFKIKEEMNEGKN